MSIEAEPRQFILLPWPPSTNNLRTNSVRGRPPTKAYEAWREAADRAFEAQKTAGTLPPYWRGPVELRFYFNPPDGRSRDISNYVKAAEDYICERGLIVDDNQTYVRAIVLRWVDKDVVDGGVLIEIIQIAPESLFAGD